MENDDFMLQAEQAAVQAAALEAIATEEEAEAEAEEEAEEAEAVQEEEAEEEAEALSMVIYLASSSPRRRELLQAAGVDFIVRVPRTPVDETLTPEELADPYTAVRTLAERKAGALVQELLAEDLEPGAYVVLGADTLVVCGAEVFGKPQDSVHASHMLHELSGRTHQVMTGVAVWMILANEDHEVSVGFRSWTDESQVTFRTLSDDEILEYVGSGEPFGKAGSYAIQGAGKAFVRHVQGELDTVIGLPVNHLLREFPELLQV